jgi:ribosomal protein L29
MNAQEQELKARIDTVLPWLRTISDEWGEFEQLKKDLARLKTEVTEAEQRLSAMRADYADVDRRRANAIAEAQAEHSRLIAAGTEELGRLNAEIAERRAEVAEARDVLALRDALKQRLNGG